MKYIVLFITTLLVVSCKNENSKEIIKKDVKKEKKINKLELEYAINKEYKIGDVRRYGVMPNEGVGNHPISKKNSFETIFDIAEKTGMKIVFPKGYYPANLLIKGRKNLNIHFEDAFFGGYVQVIEKDSVFCENVSLSGTLNVYDLMIIRNSKKTTIENLNIISDIEKNTFKTRSKGVRIYEGVEELKIKNVIIEDLGSGKAPDYERVHAAFLATGAPEDIIIDKLHIKSSDRHGVYLTGSDHAIENIIIDQFGVGSIAEMANMPDVIYQSSAKELTGVWLSRCNNSIIGNIIINTSNSKGKYAIRLDNGTISETTEVNSVRLIGGDKKLSIYAEEDTNIVVKSVEK